MPATVFGKELAAFLAFMQPVLEDLIWECERGTDAASPGLSEEVSFVLDFPCPVSEDGAVA
jgi:hypothetical protein